MVCIIRGQSIKKPNFLKNFLNLQLNLSPSKYSSPLLIHCSQRPGTCFAGWREGPVSSFLLSLLPSEIGDLLVRISTSRTRKRPQGPNLERGGLGDNSRLMVRQKLTDKQCICQQTRHKLCGNTTHLQFVGQNQVARTFAGSYFFGNFTDS